MNYSTLNHFYNDLVKQFDEATSGSSTEIFTRIILPYLEDKSITSNTCVCTYNSPSKVQRKSQVNAYALDELYEHLELFVTYVARTDEPKSVPKADLVDAAGRCVEFLKTAIEKDLIQEESRVAYELTQTIKQHYKTLTEVKIFILTNQLYAKPLTDLPNSVYDIPIRYELYDLNRFYSLVTDASSEMIECNLEQDFGGALPCLAVPTKTAEYEVYLAVVPAETLAKLYGTFDKRLLEQNVRCFLEFTSKINQKIRATLKDDQEREMFLAYNNGISATAQSVTCIRLPDGRTAIQKIKDLQIVNGGQTTVTIYRTFMEKGKAKVDLSNVFVQMKLSVIKNTDKMRKTVRDIATYANTQNKIVSADFTITNPFLVNLEKISRYHHAPAAHGSTSVSYWFFERVRGQYNDTLYLQFIAKQKALFENKHPKAQRFSKEAMSKYYNAWAQYPHIVANGNQKCYTYFMSILEKEKLKSDELFFEDLIAKFILFGRAEALYGDKRRKNAISDMRYITVPYSLAWLSFATQKTNQVLNLRKIWNQQTLSTELSDFLLQLMGKIDEFIKVKSPRGLFTEWCKKEDCWKAVKVEKFMDLSLLANDLIDPDKLKKRGTKSEADWQQAEQEAKIRHLRSISPQVWRNMQLWGRETGKLTIPQIDMIERIKDNLEAKKILTELQVKNGFDIIGFILKQVEDSSIFESAPQDLEYLKVTPLILEQVIKWNNRHLQLSIQETFELSMFNASQKWSEEQKKMIWSKVKRFKNIAFYL